MKLPGWLSELLWPSTPPVRITRSEPRPANPPGSSSLSGLLDALEDVAERHTEIFDTNVRERMWAVVERR